MFRSTKRKPAPLGEGSLPPGRVCLSINNAPPSFLHQLLEVVPLSPAPRTTSLLLRILARLVAELELRFFLPQRKPPGGFPHHRVCTNNVAYLLSFH